MARAGVLTGFSTSALHLEAPTARPWPSGYLVEPDGLPLRVVRLAEPRIEIAGAQEAIRHQPAVLAQQLHQYRHVGVGPILPRPDVDSRL